MAAETQTSLKAKIHGVVYDLPAFDELGVADWEFIYKRTDLVLADFAPILDDRQAELERQRRVNQPGFIRCQIEIAMQRANPDMAHESIAELVGETNYLEVLEYMADSLEDDAGPPDTTPEPEQSSPSAGPEFSESGSPSSKNGSEVPEEHPAATGTPG